MKKSLLILTGLALTCNQISAIGYSITVKNETPNDITVHVTSKSKTTNPVTIAGKTNQKISTESGPRRLFWSVAKVGGDYRTKDEYNSPDEMTITDIGKKFDMIERSAGKIIKEHKNQTAFVIKADNETLKKEQELKETQEKNKAKIKQEKMTKIATLKKDVLEIQNSTDYKNLSKELWPNNTESYTFGKKDKKDQRTKFEKLLNSINSKNIEIKTLEKEINTLK